jgi:hypothetical protein
MPAAWIIYHEDGQVRTMHAYSVEQAKEFAKLYTESNKWAWAHVAQEVERYDSPDYLRPKRA